MDLRNRQKDRENPEETERSWGLCVINNTEQQKRAVEETGRGGCSPGESFSAELNSFSLPGQIAALKRPCHLFKAEKQQGHISAASGWWVYY